MRDPTTSVSEARRSGTLVVFAGIAAIVAILLIAAVFLFLTLPDANAFDTRVERLFIENDDLTQQAEIKLLEILAQSGTAFSETLASLYSSPSISQVCTVRPTLNRSSP